MSLLHELGLDLETTEDLLDSWTSDIGTLLQALASENERVAAQGSSLDAAGQGLKTAVAALAAELEALGGVLAEVETTASASMLTLESHINDTASLPGALVEKIQPDADRFGERLAYAPAGDDDYSCKVDELPLQIDLVRRAAAMPPVTATLDDFVQKATRYHFSANEDMSGKHAVLTRTGDALEHRYEAALADLASFTEGIEQAVDRLRRAYPVETEWMRSTFPAEIVRVFSDQLRQATEAEAGAELQAATLSAEIRAAVEAERAAVEERISTDQARVDQEGRIPVLATAHELDAAHLQRSLSTVRACRTSTVTCSGLLPELEIVTQALEPVVAGG